jgi:hypothetical protein
MAIAYSGRFMPLALPSEPNTQAPQGTAHRLLTLQRSTHFPEVPGSVTIAELATKYAKERIVFDRPIGQNQAVAHPLADSWIRLESARLMAMHAAKLYDDHQNYGIEAAAAKYLGAEAGFDACDRAMSTHGG